MSSEAAGLEENQIVNVRFVSSGRKPSTAEWIVNCNENFPQVVSPSGTNSDVDIAHPPSAKSRFKYELWFAACRNQFAKATETAEAEPPKQPSPDQDSQRPATQAKPLESAITNTGSEGVANSAEAADAVSMSEKGPATEENVPTSERPEASSVESLIKTFLLGSLQPDSKGFVFDGAEVGDRLSQAEFRRWLMKLELSPLRTESWEHDGPTLVVSLKRDSRSTLCQIIDQRLQTCFFFEMARQPSNCEQLRQGIQSAIIITCQVDPSYGTEFLLSGEAFFIVDNHDLYFAGYLPIEDYSGLDAYGKEILAIEAKNEFKEKDEQISVHRCPRLDFNNKRRRAPCESYVLDRSTMKFRSVSGRNSLGRSMLDVYDDLGQRLIDRYRPLPDQ